MFYDIGSDRRLNDDSLTANVLDTLSRSEMERFRARTVRRLSNSLDGSTSSLEVRRNSMINEVAVRQYVESSCV
jgi:hypothetical protein